LIDILREALKGGAPHGRRNRHRALISTSTASAAQAVQNQHAYPVFNAPNRGIHFTSSLPPQHHVFAASRCQPSRSVRQRR
jgi:hypothetical protein